MIFSFKNIAAFHLQSTLSLYLLLLHEGFGDVRVLSRALLGVLSDEATGRERFGPLWGFSSVTSHNCLTDQIYTVESML